MPSLAYAFSWYAFCSLPSALIYLKTFELTLADVFGLAVTNLDLRAALETRGSCFLAPIVVLLYDGLRLTALALAILLYFLLCPWAVRTFCGAISPLSAFERPSMYYVSTFSVSLNWLPIFLYSVYGCLLICSN